MLTPSEYKEFCETTYNIPSSINRHDYLRLRFLSGIGKLATIYLAGLEDNIEIDENEYVKSILCDLLWCNALVDAQNYRSHVRWRKFSDDSDFEDSETPLYDLLMRASSESYFVDSDIQDICIECGYDVSEIAMASMEMWKQKQEKELDRP